MSIQVPVHLIQEDHIRKFEKELLVEEKIKPMKKRSQMFYTPKSILACHKHNDMLLLPFSFGVSQTSFRQFRPPRNEKTAMNLTFTGTLRPEQVKCRDELLEALSKHGSTIFSMYPGGGKCLARNTLVMMTDGYMKKVQDVQPRDSIMGDDGLPRNILSTCRGVEDMYRITYDNSLSSPISYVVNRSHILSLYSLEEERVVHLPLEEFLGNRYDPSKYRGVVQDYSPYYPSRHVLDSKHLDDFFMNVHDMERLLSYDISERRMILRDRFRMKRRQKYTISLMNDDHRDVLENFCRLTGLGVFFEEVKYQAVAWDEYDILLDVNKRVIRYLPWTWKFEAHDDYFGFEIDGNRVFQLGNGVITHNTMTSIEISSRIGLKTLIIVNRLVLIDQWIESINRAFDGMASVQVIKSKTTLGIEHDFYILNAVNAEKKTLEQYASLGIGFLIVDECHLIATRVLIRSLMYFTPRYLLGLSATPFRPDGMDKLLDLYFGYTRVFRPMFRAHTVYKIETGLKIRFDGSWNDVIEQQTTNEDRNRLIVNLITHEFTDRNILVLTKRIKHIETLHRALMDLNVYACTLKESETAFDKNARVLLSTFTKVGTGFSHDKLDMLIVACDTEEYFMQYLGRVFRTPDVNPIIIDIVDKQPILLRHYRTREKIYVGAGGEITNYMSGLLTLKPPSKE